MHEDETTREPGQPGDGNSANRVIITKPREWIPAKDVAGKLGLTVGGLMHRVKVMGRLSDSKHTAGPTSPTLLSADLAGALYAEGKPNIRANGNQMERKKIVPLKGKTLDCIGLDEPFKPNPAPKRTPERADVVAVCQLLREKIAAYQAALDALHQL